MSGTGAARTAADGTDGTDGLEAAPLLDKTRTSPKTPAAEKSRKQDQKRNREADANISVQAGPRASPLWTSVTFPPFQSWMASKNLGIVNVVLAFRVPGSLFTILPVDGSLHESIW